MSAEGLIHYDEKPAKCEYCGKECANERGRKVHEAKCEKKRMMERKTGPPVKAPETLGHSDIPDPASRKIKDVIGNLAESVRASKLTRLTIEHEGSNWHVDATWNE